MSIVVSHDCWDGGASGFRLWREGIAKAAGYAVGGIIFENKTHPLTLPLIDWGHVVEENYLGNWEKTPHDILIVLIAHSDCIGYIHPIHAAPLADRLEDLLPKITRETHPIPELARDQTRRFIAGLRDAASKNEPVEFS